jgi:ring-1,2-phenylacetyl-CoA epoxidase subunit PaaD
VVSPTSQDVSAALRVRAWRAAASVVDPEIPVLSIVDLGVLREITVRDDDVEIVITPTYSGCPAMRVIEFELAVALRAADIEKFHIHTVLAPAWSSDWLSEEGRAKLTAYGIAPPQPKAGRRALFGHDAIACPRCGSSHTERLAEFGSTACKALYRCRDCAEPFDYFKCL